MTERLPFEQQAFEAALLPLGEGVAEIGIDKPLSAYTREEILTLIQIVVYAYQDRMLQILSDQTLEEEGVPFDAGL